MNGETDAARLVRRAQHGDTLAMNELLDLLAPFVGRICGPIALTQGPDAAQETLIAIFTSLRTLREPESVWGWARRIAVRESVKTARRFERDAPAELSELPGRGDPTLGADIGDMLRRLSPEHRAILLLRDLEGFRESEAAVILGVEVGTAKSRLHRARRFFRKAWSS